MQQYFTGKLFLLSLLLSFISLDATQAQTTSLFFEDQEVEPGTMINVDLKVSDFTDMLGMQFSVNWDPQVLEYQIVESFGLSDITLQANFGLDSAEVGRLGFLWIDSNVAGESMVDSSVLFSIKFIVVGPSESSTTVSFANIPTVIELSDNDGVIEALLVNGTISVAEPNATFFNSAPDQIKVIDVYPNPFSSHTTLDFEIAVGDQLALSIIDTKGKKIYKQQNFYAAGKHAIVLNKEIFPAAGIYYYELVSSNFKVSQRLIHITD